MILKFKNEADLRHFERSGPVLNLNGGLHVSEANAFIPEK